MDGVSVSGVYEDIQGEYVRVIEIGERIFGVKFIIGGTSYSHEIGSIREVL